MSAAHLLLHGAVPPRQPVVEQLPMIGTVVQYQPCRPSKRKKFGTDADKSPRLPPAISQPSIGLLPPGKHFNSIGYLNSDPLTTSDPIPSRDVLLIDNDGTGPSQGNVGDVLKWLAALVVFRGPATGRHKLAAAGFYAALTGMLGGAALWHQLLGGPEPDTKGHPAAEGGSHPRDGRATRASLANATVPTEGNYSAPIDGAVNAATAGIASSTGTVHAQGELAARATPAAVAAACTALLLLLLLLALAVRSRRKRKHVQRTLEQLELGHSKKHDGFAPAASASPARGSSNLGAGLRRRQPRGQVARHRAASENGVPEVCRQSGDKFAVDVPDDVAEIAKEAFYGCTSLVEVTLPPNLTEIGWSAFFRCTSLSEITLPPNLTEIGGAAFSGCTSLSEITLPPGPVDVGLGAFAACPGTPRRA